VTDVMATRGRRRVHWLVVPTESARTMLHDRIMKLVIIGGTGLIGSKLVT
jgi:hypothetical protein